MADWYEPLPDKCPPQEAFAPNGSVYYRLSQSGEIKNEEFLSYRMLFPDKKFANVTECISHSLSVIDDIEQCRNLMSLPKHKKYKETIALMKLNLIKSDGMLMKTFNNQNHFSWWRTKSFSFDTVEIIK